VKWVQAPTPVAAEGLTADGIEPLIARLLARRGIDTAEAARAFLEPSLEQLADPFLLDGMEEAVERLARAATAGEKVAIVGDYDVDGISSTALLTAVFRAAGMEVEPILPDRLTEGYGFQPLHVERAGAAGCSLVVTADCGSTSHSAIAAARDAGLEVIVTDHHLLEGSGPTDCILINPRRPGNRYPFDELCAAGLALQLARALEGRLGSSHDPARLARIACLGTICDMVPLVGENRAITALGLAALPETPSPGLQALFQSAGVRPPIGGADVGFRIGPRLNAAGRMASPEPALELLLTRDRLRARELATQLEELNQRRRASEDRAVEAAREEIASRPELPGILVAWHEEWHRGVLGIAAGRLAKEFSRPALLLQVEGELATGSGRSVSGIHLFDTLAPWRDELERFGGHAQAVGLTARTSDLPRLRAAWEEAARSFDPELLVPRLRYEETFAPAEVNSELLARLERLSPFGVGNPRPVLRVGPLRLSAPPRAFGTNHLGLVASGPDRARLDLVAWGWADRSALFEGAFEVAGRLEMDGYLRRPVLQIADARSATSTPPEAPADSGAPARGPE
jgi:single-stranded-DNA-specific exonuclease